MNQRSVIKMIIDILMTFCLIFLMGYQFWGEVAHEWVGVGMLVLFILHHILNWNWHKNLLRGKYSVMRTITLCINMLILFCMIAQMYSGIVISREVFKFMPQIGNMAFARKLHILGAYWGFLLMSLHLGLHWNMILVMMRKAIGDKFHFKLGKLVVFLVGLTIAFYGIWVFISRDFPTYLFLKSEFVFLDYSESKIKFYLDYLALMGLCIFIAHYFTKFIRKRKI